MFSKTKKTILLYHPLVEKSVAKPRSPPIPLLSIAGPLLKEGYDTQIFDAIIDPDAQEKILEKLNDSICLGITVLTGYSIVDCLKLASKVKRINPKFLIVLGGWHPSLLPLETIKHPCVDIIVRGQGEATFCELVQHLEKNSSLRNVLGITYKSGQKVITNPDRPLIPLDEFPPLPYHLIDIEKYINNVIGLGKRTLGYISSRGCPYNCSFCADVRVWKRKRLDLSAERVLEDLKLLIEKYNINGIAFDDNNFFVNMDKVKKICQGIIKNKWDIKWGAYERVDHFTSLDEETIKLVKDSGCSLLIPGAESGSQKILDFLNKGFKVEDTINFSRLCQKYDIAVRFALIVGLPNETEEDFNKTLAMIKTIYPLHEDNEVVLSFYTPFPGTQLYDLISRKYGFKKPKSLEAWAEFDPGYIETVWVDKKYKEKLNRFLFYLQFAFLNRHFKKKIKNFKKFKFLIWPMHKIALLRLKFNFFKLPIEKNICDFLKKYSR